jgi:hypothetical protein
MAVRAQRSAPAEHLEDLAYLIAHLKADPQSAAFAPGPEAASEALKTQIEDWSSKRHTVKETQTGLGNVEEVLAKVVRTAQAVILDDLRRGGHGLVHDRSAHARSDGAFKRPRGVIYPNEHDRVRSYFRRVTHRPRATAPAEGESASETKTPATGTTAPVTASEATPAAPALSLTPAFAGS